MARNDNERLRAPADHAHLRAGADSWPALASAAVVSMGLVPALIVGALFLIEALFATPVTQTAQLPAPQIGSHAAHANDRLAARLSNLCARRHPSVCAAH
jgi:hypothetical protein